MSCPNISIAVPKSLTDLIREGINLATGNPIDERCAIAERVAVHVADGLAEQVSGGGPGWMLRDILKKRAANAAKAPGNCL